MSFLVQYYLLTEIGIELNPNPETDAKISNIQKMIPFAHNLYIRKSLSNVMFQESIVTSSKQSNILVWTLFMFRYCFCIYLCSETDNFIHSIKFRELDEL